MAKCVFGCLNDVTKKGKSFDIAVLVHGVVGHVHITLADGLAFDASEVNSLLYWIVLDDFDDGETFIVSILTTILPSRMPMCRILTLSSSPGNTIPTKETS